MLLITIFVVAAFASHIGGAPAGRSVPGAACSFLIKKNVNYILFLVLFMKRKYIRYLHYLTI